MRERVRDRAAHLREAAAAHDTAADSLERHLTEVDVLKDQIADTERKADKLVADARARVAQIEDADDPAGVDRAPDPEDIALTAFTPPPSGHKDWLTVNLPGPLTCRRSISAPPRPRPTGCSTRCRAGSP